MIAERRKPRTRPVRGGWKVTPPWSTLTTEDEEAMQEGARLAVLLDGVSVPMVKTSDGRWRVETHGGVQAARLIGRPVAARVPRGEP